MAHFALNYLSYFVFGADLPTALKEAFFEKAQQYFGTTEQLIQLARQQVRELHRYRTPRTTSTRMPSPVGTRLWLRGVGRQGRSSGCDGGEEEEVNRATGGRRRGHRLSIAACRGRQL
jgi:hypothetical protein